MFEHEKCCLEQISYIENGVDWPAYNAVLKRLVG